MSIRRKCCVASSLQSDLTFNVHVIKSMSIAFPERYPLLLQAYAWKLSIFKLSLVTLFEEIPSNLKKEEKILFIYPSNSYHTYAMYINPIIEISNSSISQGSKAT